MEFIDTHTHPHMEGYEIPVKEFVALNQQAGVKQFICVGTDADNSLRAIEMASNIASAHATIGLHPHDASMWRDELPRLKQLVRHEEVVGVGECGLDYYYENSPKQHQIEALHAQISLAQQHNMPMVFHVRDAFDDFFKIYDEHLEGGPIPGVVHSFTADISTLNECLKRDLYIGLNGIMTFTKDEAQLAAAKEVPLERLVLETDAPFLTPVPFRGKVNNSAHTKTVAEFLSNIRGETLDVLARTTTRNAKELFRI